MLRAVPPWPSDSYSSIQIHNLADERRVLWQTIQAPAMIKAQGRLLWTTLKEFNRYWPEFQSYIVQAKVYDDAAEAVEGASGALLAYYSALNLAKAELLVSDPSQVYNKTVRHGLGYRPSRRSFRAEFVATDSGVFPLLYKARTGVELAHKLRLPIVSLLSNISDVGHEMSSAGLGPGNVSPIFHYVATRDEHMAVGATNEAWSVIGLPEATPSVLASAATKRFLGDHFELVESGHNYLTAWLGGGLTMQHMLQSRDVHLFDATNAHTIVEEVTAATAESVRPIQGHLTYGWDEWTPSIRKSSWLPMPPDLARYAAIFYCSSIARYRPSLLHADSQGEAAWILNAFVMEARLLLLRSAVQGITGRYIELQQGSRL